MFFIPQKKIVKRSVSKGLKANSVSRNLIDNLKVGQVCILLGTYKGTINHHKSSDHRIINVCIWNGNFFNVNVITSFTVPTGSIGNNTGNSNRDINTILAGLSNTEKATYIGIMRKVGAVVNQTLVIGNVKRRLPTVKVLTGVLTKEFDALYLLFKGHVDAFIDKDAKKIKDTAESGKRNGAHSDQSFYGDKAVKLYKTIMLLKVLSPLTFAIVSSSNQGIYSFNLPFPKWFIDSSGINDIYKAVKAHHNEQGINYSEIVKLSGSNELTRVNEVMYLICVTHISFVGIHKNHPLGGLYTKYFKKGVISTSVKFVTGDITEMPGDTGLGVVENTITEQLQNVSMVPIGTAVEINMVITNALRNRVDDKIEYDETYKRLKDWSAKFNNKAFPKILQYHLHVITGIFGTPCHNDLDRDTTLKTLAFMYVHTKELGLPLSFYLPFQDETQPLSNAPLFNTKCLFNQVDSMLVILPKQARYIKDTVINIPTALIEPFTVMDNDLPVMVGNQTKNKHILFNVETAYVTERTLYVSVYAEFFKNTNKYFN